jgi:hypothetical protein
MCGGGEFGGRCGQNGGTGARREAGPTQTDRTGLPPPVLRQTALASPIMLTSCSYESSNTSSSPSRYSRTSSPTRILHAPPGTSSGRCAVSRALVEPQCGSRWAPPCRAEKVDSPMPRAAMSDAAGMESSRAEVTGHRLRLRDTCRGGGWKCGRSCGRSGVGCVRALAWRGCSNEGDAFNPKGKYPNSKGKISGCLDPHHLRVLPGMPLSIPL